MQSHPAILPHKCERLALFRHDGCAFCEHPAVARAALISFCHIARIRCHDDGIFVAGKFATDTLIEHASTFMEHKRVVAFNDAHRLPAEFLQHVAMDILCIVSDIVERFAHLLHLSLYADKFSAHQISSAR